MFAMRFEGGQQLAKRLQQLPLNVGRRTMLQALKDGAEPIQERAADLAPRAPGAPDLADHIVVATVRGEDPTVAVGPTREFLYGFYQEFGTSRHSAQPFMRPAFNESPKSLGIIGGALWRALIGQGQSSRIGQGDSESFATSRAPSLRGGPGGGLL